MAALPHQDDSTDAEPREAVVSDYDDQPIAACIVLSPADLRRLGIDPDTTSIVLYWVDAADQQLIINANNRG